MKSILVLSAVALCLAATVGQAQQAPAGGRPQSTAREDGLDPTPVDPATDPDIDLFINDWKTSRPRTLYGKLVFRDILTRNDGPDPVRPARKGAVLSAITAISYATLAPGATATGRAARGERQVFFATAGTGRITVNSNSYDIKDGSGFTLTPDFDFTLTSTGRQPLALYVRSEPLPANFTPSENIMVVNRFDNDRRVGAHWAHICNGGPNGMNLCTIAPYTIPQPHSHPQEEVWLAVKGESILSLGKHLRRMVPGEAYRIPPTGVTAHSNLNMGAEPVQLIYMGPAARADAPASPPPAPRDYARLDNSPFNRATEQDIDMFMGNWRDAFPRIVHGNLYFRDMLTALQGPDSLHPTRKGAVLTNAEAVSHVMLEPGATAHLLEGELKGIQETFVVNSGTGIITSDAKKFELSKGKAFVITPGLDFRLTATGDQYLTFYVVSEKLPEGFAPKATLEVVDNSGKVQVMTAWNNKERALISKSEGLSQFGALTQVELPSMTMSRPYSAAQGAEEIWIATDGDVDLLFGKQLRKMPAGTAYRVPPTGITAHANINLSSKPAGFIYMVK